MGLSPIGAPRFGLAFGSRSVALVERAGWGGGLRRRPIVRRVQEHPLPSGMILPTDTAVNIVDPAALTAEVRGFLAPLRGQSVALSLPDQATSMALFEFDALPKQADECDALLRWRMREDLGLAPADMRLASHVFRARGRCDTSEVRPRSTTRVLTIGVRRQVLAQYEGLCEALGLLPVAIGVGSLDLFDLCRARMPRTPEVWFAHASADGLTVIGLRAGIPVFVRMKSRRHRPLDVTAELLGTLQFYEDLVAETDPAGDRADACVWLIDTNGQAGEDPELAAGAPLAAPAAEGFQVGGRQIPIMHLGWETLATLKPRGEAPPASGLPALAGLVAA